MKDNQIDAARRVPEAMRAAGIMPTVYTYTLLIQLCVKSQSFEDASAFYREMLVNRIQPNLHTLTLLLKACAESGQMRQAAHVMNKMHSLGLRPNDFVFNTLMYGFIRQGNQRAADEILSAMLRWGVPVDGVTVTIRSRALLSQGRGLQAFDFVLANLPLINYRRMEILLRDFCQHSAEVILGIRQRQDGGSTKTNSLRLVSADSAGKTSDFVSSIVSKDSWQDTADEPAQPSEIAARALEDSIKTLQVCSAAATVVRITIFSGTVVAARKRAQSLSSSFEGLSDAAIADLRAWLFKSGKGHSRNL